MREVGDADWHRTYDALLGTEALEAAGRAISRVEAKRSAELMRETARGRVVQPITYEDSARAAIEAALDVARALLRE